MSRQLNCGSSHRGTRLGDKKKWMPKHLTTSRVSGVMPSETGQFQKLGDRPISFAQRQRRWHFYLGPGVQRGHLPHVDLTCFLSVLWGFVSENCSFSSSAIYSWRFCASCLLLRGVCASWGSSCFPWAWSVSPSWKWNFHISVCLLPIRGDLSWALYVEIGS